uniref:Uncharacterized protein n=1 Tax=Sinocyclocheilus rhinocerous TaxID=307959 RepID=A0A673GA79_9TELE
QAERKELQSCTCIPPQELHRRNQLPDATQTKVLNTVISVKVRSLTLILQTRKLMSDHARV